LVKSEIPMNNQYTNKFYQQRRKQTLASAQIILKKLFTTFSPKLIIDFGCATGIWLAECKRLGATKTYGVDGDWVDRDLLEIDSSEFKNHDFGQLKYNSEYKYELAMCIEVAEHLSEEMGSMLIDSLTETSDVILFSAAVCGQGGTGHINEQAQYYWAQEFSKRDYVCLDLLRPEIWENETVNVIYKQNMLVYVRQSVCDRLSLESKIISQPFELNRIHPDLFLKRSSSANTGRMKNILGGLNLLAKGIGIKR